MFYKKHDISCLCALIFRNYKIVYIKKSSKMIDLRINSYLYTRCYFITCASNLNFSILVEIKSNLKLWILPICEV